ARVEGVHVGMQARDDLDDRKTFGLAIGGELLKFIGPVQALAQAHPPRVAEPKERRAVRVDEVAMVGRDLDEAMAIARVIAGVRLDLDRTFDAIEAAVVL